MSFIALSDVKELSAHQRREEESVDRQGDDLRVDERDGDPVVVEEAATAAPELVDLLDDGAEGEVVLDPPFLLCPGDDGPSPDQRHPIFWVLKITKIFISRFGCSKL